MAKKLTVSLTKRHPVMRILAFLGAKLHFIRKNTFISTRLPDLACLPNCSSYSV